MNSAFLVAPAAFLFILPFPHTVALRLLMLLILVASVAWSWRRLSPPPIPLKPALFLWALIAVISLFWAVDPAYSLGEIKVEVGYGMLAYLGFFALSQDKQTVKNQLYVLTVSIVGASLLYLVRRYPEWQIFDWMRYHSPGIGNMSTYVVTVIPMLLLLIAIHYRGWIEAISLGGPLRKILAVLVALLALSIIAFVMWSLFSSQNRMAWIVLLLQFGVMLKLWNNIDKRVRWSIFVVIFIGMAFTFTNVVNKKARSGSYSVEVVYKEMMKDPRTELWGRVADIIAEKPLTGEGFGRQALAKAHDDFAGNIAKWHAHNLVLNYGAQMGGGGVVVLLLLFAMIFRQYWGYLSVSHELRLIGITGIAVTVGVFSKNMTDDFFNRDLALLFWAQMGILMGWGERLKRAIVQQASSSH